MRDLEIALSLATREIQSMTDRMAENRAGIASMESRLNRIEQTLVRIEERGKIQDYGALQARIEALDKFRWWVMGVAAAVGGIAGFLVKLL
jgi:uncharacterized coiled-coil protein SlyX